MSISLILVLSSDHAPIGPTLESLAGQTRPPTEVLLVHLGQTRPRIHREFDGPGLREIACASPENEVGIYHGLEACSERFAMLVRPGDRLHPDHLARLGARLEASPLAPGAVTGWTELPTDGAPGFTLWDDFSEPVDPWQCFPLRALQSSSQVLFRREAFWNTEGLNPGDRSGETFLWLGLTARRGFVRVDGRTVATAAEVPPLLAPGAQWEACDRFFTLAQHCLAVRLKYHPAEATRLRRRLRIMRHVVAWRFAESMLLPGQSQSITEAVDDLLQHETAHFQQAVFKEAFAWFPLEAEPDANRMAHAMRLLRLWRRVPPEARMLRSALRRQFRGDPAIFSPDAEETTGE